MSVEIDVVELRRRVHLDPKPTSDREFRCPECGTRCTRTLDPGKEAGHKRGCSRRMKRTGAERRRPALTDGGIDR
jgi:hypothetical protein